MRRLRAWWLRGGSGSSLVVAIGLRPRRPIVVGARLLDRQDGA